MSLTERQKRVIRENYNRLSVRQIAKELNCSRSEVEKCIKEVSSQGVFKPLRCIPKLPSVLLVIIIFALTFITFSNSIHYDFVWDDSIQIEKNPLIRPKTVLGALEIFKFPVGVIPGSQDYASASYRPLQVLSYWLTNFFWGLRPSVFHLTNILLQCIAAVLLFLLLLQLLKSKEVAFWTSAFFAIHPVQIAAVTYVSGRSESITMIFMIGSFLLFYHFIRTRSVAKYFYLVLSAVLYLAAVLTKEIAIVLPLLFYIYWLIFGKKEGLKVSALNFGWYFLAVLGYMVLRCSVLGKIGQGGIGDLPTSVRFFGVFMSIFHYIRLLFFPYGLHMAYQLPVPYLGEPTVVMGFIFLLILLALTWLSRRSPVLLFGFAWFWVFLVPVLNIFILLNGPIAEHWLYNALIGFFIVLVGGLLSLADRKIAVGKIVEVLLACAVLNFAVTTFHSDKVWKDEISLFTNVLKYTQRFADVYNNLGSAYIKKNDLKAAETNFRKALEIDPAHKNAQHNLQMLERQKRYMGYQQS